MDRIHTALEVLIVSLNNHLRDATRTAEMAETAIANGHRNQAIGCLLESERQIGEIKATFDTILSIHRTTK